MNMAALLRRQWHSPLFFLTVFALVAAVVAINATTFGAIHTLRWKALPYAADDCLVWLRADLRKLDVKTGLGESLRRVVAADREHFAATAGFVMPRRTRSDSEGRGWHIAPVTPGFEGVIGVAPALGRSFNADDAHAGADRVLLISDALWRSRFNADPQILGRTVRFGDQTDSVIGVMPRGFAFPDTNVDAWRPYVAAANASPESDFGDLDVIARLAAGTRLAQARAALDTVLNGGKSLPGIFASLDVTASAEPWRQHFFDESGHALSLLQIVALVLLAAVAANLVNLQLDRLLGRAREFEIRRALGAGEGAIVASAVGDTLLPVAAGLLAGLALTVPGTQLLARRGLLPESMPLTPAFDWATLACGIVVAFVALATATLAARLSRGRSGLSARGSASGLGRVRPALLVGQIMLTTALLGGAGLLLRSTLNVIHVDRGFDAQGVLMTGIDLSNPAQRLQYDPRGDAGLKSSIADLRAQAAALPGVQHVALANIAPFSGGETFGTVEVPGQAQSQQVRLRMVTPGYFAALGMPLVSGRDFDWTDIHEDGGYPVIVDGLYAQRYLRGIDPLASHVGTGSPDGAGNFNTSPIIGVVRATKQAALDENAEMPTIYAPSNGQMPMFILVLRGSGDPASLIEPVRRLIQSRMPDAAIAFNQPLGQRVEHSLNHRRALLEAVGGFAALTLALAALGLAAVLGFAIRRRTSELGVRLALGATPSRIRRLVLRQGSMLIASGLALGLATGLVLARLLADRLFGVTFTDPANWCATVLLVAAIALFACWLPARRAAATDPIEALRHE